MAAGDLADRILVQRRNDFQVRSLHLGRANASEGPVLKHPKQLGL